MIISCKKNIFILTCFVILMFICWIFSCGWIGGNLKLVESTEFLMNTNVTVKMYIGNKNKGKNLLTKVFTEAKRIEHIMESSNGDGELQRINRSSAKEWWVLSPELKVVIDRAFFFYEKSGGAFDPTIASVKWLWEFEKGGRVPSENEIKEALETVGLSRIKMKNDSLSLCFPGTKLDLGGIAKGYVVDRMIRILEESGVSAGLINAGGDIYTFGKKPGGNDWIIALRHPRMNKTIVLDTISLPAVATSGDYERYFINDGVRYHHILDPSKGYPARGCISATVWTNTAMDADILATAIFVLGPQKGLKLAENMDDVETLVFFEEDDSVKYVMSSGIRDSIKL